MCSVNGVATGNDCSADLQPIRVREMGERKPSELSVGIFCGNHAIISLQLPLQELAIYLLGESLHQNVTIQRSDDFESCAVCKGAQMGKANLADHGNFYSQVTKNKRQQLACLILRLVSPSRLDVSM